MIVLDSWIFIEYFSDMENKSSADLVENPSDTRAISSAVLAEVKYRISKKFGNSKASDAIDAINSLPNLRILPVTKEIAEFAAELRLKYYSKERQLSYIDVINLATAIKIGCDKFYTGDPDFEGISEIEIKNIRQTKTNSIYK
ncbi:MAG: PIN domain-containing protein [Candidatus Aenigmatarchaeota archaeon]